MKILTCPFNFLLITFILCIFACIPRNSVVLGVGAGSNSIIPSDSVNLGDLEVTPAFSEVNAPISLNQPIYSGSSTITVPIAMSASGVLLNGAYSVGTEILIIQMQQSVGSNFNRETAIIQSISGGSNPQNSSEISINVPLTFSYFSNSSGVRAQIVNLPQYSNIRIPTGMVLTAPAWSSSAGGILAVRASETIFLSGAINMDFRGFRGGGGQSQGEGWSGPGAVSNTDNNGGGGGMLQSGITLASGGGGYGTSGQDCNNMGWLAKQGGSYGSPDLYPMMPGGGGGGASNAGGNGGGMILVYANSLKLSPGASFSANGAPGSGDSSGGAGGSIYILANSMTGTGSMSAIGGSTSSGTRGSCGGDGRIRIDVPGVASTPLGISISTSQSNSVFFGFANH